MTTQPSPHDLDAWRALLWQAPDRTAAQQLVREWALALGAHEVTDPGRATVLHLPFGTDEDAAGALWMHAVTNGVPMRAAVKCGGPGDRRSRSLSRDNLRLRK
jgi:hypothetical protein